MFIVVLFSTLSCSNALSITLSTLSFESVLLVDDKETNTHVYLAMPMTGCVKSLWWFNVYNVDIL